MTNKKFKHASDNIQIQRALIVGTRNLMTLYLALHQHGVSVSKVLYLDDKLLKDYVPKYKQDANAGVLLYRAKTFLSSVGIEWREVAEIVTNISMPYLAGYKYDRAQLCRILEAHSEDMAMYLQVLNFELGYGHKRLTRVLDAVKAYKGDALTDASKVFGFDYGDMNELPTLTEPKKKLDKQTADMIRKAMTRDAG